MTPTVVEFDEVADDRYGGKAAGLAELRRLGLDVPRGFVIADASDNLVVVDLSRWFDRMADAGATPVAHRLARAEAGARPSPASHGRGARAGSRSTTRAA